MSGTKGAIAPTLVGVITGLVVLWLYPDLGFLWLILICAIAIIGFNLLIFVLPRMPICYRSFAFVLASAALVISVIWWDPYRLVDLNAHGKEIGYGVWFLLFGLALTHFILLAIMWMQRKGLWPSEAAMFRWTAMKTIFWGSSGYFFRPQDYGVPLINLVVFSLIFITTLDLDVRIFRRYILGAESGPPPQEDCL